MIKLGLQDGSSLGDTLKYGNIKKAHHRLCDALFALLCLVILVFACF